jgi:hypothetical protein
MLNLFAKTIFNTFFAQNAAIQATATPIATQGKAVEQKSYIN